MMRRVATLAGIDVPPAPLPVSWVRDDFKKLDIILIFKRSSLHCQTNSSQNQVPIIFRLFHVYYNGAGSKF